MTDLLRQLAPAALALAAVGYFDLRSRRTGLSPPGFAEPLRRVAGLAGLAAALWLAVFAALGRLGEAVAPDFSAVPTWQLFLLHGILVGGLLLWYANGFAGGGAGWRGLAEQVGLAARRPLAEVGLGLVFGVGAWLAVILTVVGVALVVSALGGDALLPQEPPAAIPWIAGQPVLLRLALALSAGTVEELFFRGLLQPRAGIVFSTALFALAHLSYQQPFLLLAVTLLSVLYALLVRWRQSIWAAIVAHAVFDGVQLLVVIPAALRLLYGGD